jgi:hypothetical protein
MLDQVNATPTPNKRLPWNKGKLTGAKPPLQPKHVWSIRTKLQIEGRAHDLAMFNLAIDNKLRGCNPAHERPLCAKSSRTERIRFDPAECSPNRFHSKLAYLNLLHFRQNLTFCDRHGAVKNVFGDFHDCKIRQCRADQEDEEQRRRRHEPQPPADDGE